MTSEFCAILSFFFLPVIIGRLSSTMCQYNMQISYRLVKKKRYDAILKLQQLGVHQNAETISSRLPVGQDS
jgi:hypothetical protein